jgi:hypothetical protein
MDIDLGVQIVTVASVAAIGTLVLNSINYWYILDIKYNDKINIRCQFIGLIFAFIYQIDLLLINMKYFEDYPIAEILLINLPWQIFFNCYFTVFIRQSDVLLPRKLFWLSWAYLVFLNGLAILDSYAYYLEYCISDEWIWFGNLIDFLSSLCFLFLECVINVWIIVKISNKVRNQNNPGYKILVIKLCIVLGIYFLLDLIIMACDLSDYQMYGCIFWGLNYAFKIQTETLCLGKIRECVMILENYENA